VYGVVGFEITPGTVIGFLTVMGYSLYDTIVVFDKVRENTADLSRQTRATFAEQVELAANQTLVRSINTSVVALLPVGSILAIGAFILGAGTLQDISLALFVGIIAGTYSSIALAPGLLVDLPRPRPAIAAHARRVEQLRHPAGAAGVGADERDEHAEETTDQEPDGPVGTETISPEPEPEPEAEATAPRPRNQPRR